MPDFYRSDNNQKEGIALAHTVYGSPLIEANRTVAESQGAGVGPATWSTAPYQEPERRYRDNPEKALCEFEDCGAWPSKKHAPYCVGHARKLGLIKNKPAEKKEPELPAWAQLEDDDGDS